MSYLFREWDEKSIRTWENYKEKGLKKFIWDRGFKRCFPVFYGSSMLGFYFLSQQEGWHSIDLMVSAILMFAGASIGSYLFALSLWHDADKSYKQFLKSKRN